MLGLSSSMWVGSSFLTEIELQALCTECGVLATEPPRKSPDPSFEVLGPLPLTFPVVQPLLFTEHGPVWSGHVLIISPWVSCLCSVELRVTIFFFSEGPRSLLRNNPSEQASFLNYSSRTTSCLKSWDDFWVSAWSPIQPVPSVQPHWPMSESWGEKSTGKNEENGHTEVFGTQDLKQCSFNSRVMFKTQRWGRGIVLTSEKI